VSRDTKPRRKPGRERRALDVVVVGAGINGLVAANYLCRGGHRVTLIERKPRVGGACVSARMRHGGRNVVYAPGASVLGMMQTFVFTETGLADAVAVFKPRHPELVYFKDEPDPVVFYGSAARLAGELRRKCDERGDVAGFERDLEIVVRFLRRGFRAATPPTLADARKRLGGRLTSRWITGSARALLDHYFTSDRVKVFYAVSVTESGCVSLDEPYSAFTIALMSSGGIFDGKWGFVKGGIWKLTEALGAIDRALGVRIVVNAKVTAIDPDARTVSYSRRGKRRRLVADRIVLATDPLTAARLVNDEALIGKISAKRFLGTSGKLVMVFDKPVVWKGDTGARDFASALPVIMLADTLDGFERATLRAGRTSVDFAPGFLEIYPEGPAMRRLGARSRFHIISVFFKNLGFDRRGRDLPAVERRVSDLVLAKIANPDDLVRTLLLTPKDLSEAFFFPEGNIDHATLAHGQTFFDRNYSADPQRSFYQLGRYADVFVCGAGSYPCGSVAGTPGYMCAQQIMRLDR